jgi:hypothetical protein
VVRESLLAAVGIGRRRAAERLAAHAAFVAERQKAGKDLAHASAAYGFPVTTRQERELRVLRPVGVRETGELAFEAEIEAISDQPSAISQKEEAAERKPGHSS